MPKISQKKKDKIQEHILHHLFEISPESKFTNQIANEIARDEEFTKNLLQDLHAKSLISLVSKNPKGKQYKSRQRWRLSEHTHTAYTKFNDKLP